MKHHDNVRINVFLIVVLMISSLILYRLFILSFLKHSVYSLTAQAQNENINNILARGNIYLKDNNDLFLAATNRKFPLAYLVPSDINPDKRDETAGKIGAILGIDKSAIFQKISSGGSSLRVLSRRIHDDQVRQIKELSIKGVGVSYEMDRFYPAKDLASNVIGFLGYDSNGKSGQYGIESYYDKDLFGNLKKESGFFAAKKAFGIVDSLKKIISHKNSGQDQANSGGVQAPVNVVLTIDKNIQIFVENVMEKLLEKWNASGGTVIVEEPNSGKILAMADRPSFDPNNYSSFRPELFLN